MKRKLSMLPAFVSAANVVEVVVHFDPPALSTFPDFHSPFFHSLSFALPSFSVLLVAVAVPVVAFAVSSRPAFVVHGSRFVYAASVPRRTQRTQVEGTFGKNICLKSFRFNLFLIYFILICFSFHFI